MDRHSPVYLNPSYYLNLNSETYDTPNPCYSLVPHERPYPSLETQTLRVVTLNLVTTPTVHKWHPPRRTDPATLFKRISLSWI